MEDDRHLLPALEVLGEFGTGSADAAIAAALPHMEEPNQERAFLVLVQRGHVPTLSDVVGSFHVAPRSLQRLIVESWRAIESAFRAAMNGPFEQSASAIEAIVASDAVELAYLLTDALKRGCEQKRELAAAGLSALAQCALTETQSLGRRAKRLTFITDALGEAILSWETHRNRGVLESALRLGRHIIPFVRRKLERRPVFIDRPIHDILNRACDDRLVEFLWCALAFPQLRASAARRIELLRDAEMISSLLSDAWLLADPKVAEGFREVRACGWLFAESDATFRLDASDIARAVPLMALSGAQHVRKLRRFRTIWRDHGEIVRRAVLWTLFEDRSIAATELLAEFQSQCSGKLAALLESELDRRNRGTKRTGAGMGVHSDQDAQRLLESRNDLDRLFNTFEKHTSEARRTSALAYESATGRLAAGILRRLRSAHPLDNRRALSLARELGRVAEFDLEVRRLAHDADARTRSLAISLLIYLPGAATARMLRQSTDDSDERVQANGIEALDRLDDPETVAMSRRLLGATGNRVRANAIRALLSRGRDHAALGALETMLAKTAASDRLSALWVAERLRLERLGGRLERMASLDPDDRVRARARQVIASIGSVPVAAGEMA